MRLTFGIIVLNGGFFLKQVLESIYPYAHAICIAEGSVLWWADNGVLGSTDDTMQIIESFPDPQNKIKVTRPVGGPYYEKGGCYSEKDDQCRAWFNLVPSDTDYVICNDADEVHTPENIEKLVRFLEITNPTSVGFKSDSFYGGFEKIIGGFERDHSFKRVLKYVPGCIYRTHRQPTLAMYSYTNVWEDIVGNDVTGNQLYDATGITMWHGSYVSPKGVYDKIRYYEGAVIAAGKCIPNYFNDVWLPWVQQPELRTQIEDKWNGVQEFIPSARGESKTIPYTGQHPDIILRDMQYFKQRFDNEIKLITNIL